MILDVLELIQLLIELPLPVLVHEQIFMANILILRLFASHSPWEAYVLSVEQVVALVNLFNFVVVVSAVGVNVLDIGSFAEPRVIQQIVEIVTASTVREVNRVNLCPLDLGHTCIVLALLGNRSSN